MRINSAFPFVLTVLPFAQLHAQGEELRALQARPMPEAMATQERSTVREHFIYQFQPQVLPLMDDFSVDRTRKRWAGPDDPDVTLDAVIHALEVDGISTPDMSFMIDTTFRYTFDLSVPDTVIVTTQALPAATVTVRDLSVYPPTEELVTGWPPYNIFDTLQAPPIDTVYLAQADLIQDSLMVYAVAPDPRTYLMNGVAQPLILWEDDDVFVNSTYPLNPPTVGVATFDGLSRNGMPYNFADYFSYGIADRLTSVPINMSGPPADSVYLSFYYQAQGLSGDIEHNSTDSLVLEFYAPQEDTWYRVWRAPYPLGLQVLPFQQVMIPIKEFRYLQDGFRMRFLNYATLSGSYDHWHLDYVRLGAQRSFDDTTIVDVAYVYSTASLLETYTSVPFNRYQQSPASFMAPSVSVLQRNLDDEDRLITWRMRANIDGEAPGTITDILGTSIANNAWTVFPSEHPIGNNSFSYDASLSTEAAFWRVQFATNATPDNNPYNDTITFVQELSNYYAYDDGTAEMGYSLISAGAKLAYRFDVAGGDSLRAIRMYFNPMANDPLYSPPPTQGSFLVTIWSSLIPEVIRHQNFSFSSPEYRDHGLNKFVEYPLDSAIWVDGTFFIGWVQTNDVRMNLGFDRNRNNQNKIFFKTGSNWQNTVYPGSLMMRPVFTTANDPWLAVATEEQYNDDLVIFPNPASQEFHLLLGSTVPNGGTMVQLRDAMGRLLREVPFGNASITTNGLAKGLYLVRVVDHAGISLGQGRLLIQP